MDPQKIIRHISFYDRKPARKPKMFAGDQMTSRQFGGWKQVTTTLDSPGAPTRKRPKVRDESWEEASPEAGMSGSYDARVCHRCGEVGGATN